MRRVVRLDILVALIGISTLLAGCGRTIGPGGALQAGASPTASTGISATATAGASSPGTPGALGKGTSGQVTLTLDRQQYGAGNTIVVTVHNGLSQAIWAADHQTACTVVTAERLQNGQWQTVGACRLMTPTTMVSLPAASATAQRLASSGWPSGTYRVTLSYNGDAGAGGSGGVAYSVEFSIG